MHSSQVSARTLYGKHVFEQFSGESPDLATSEPLRVCGGDGVHRSLWDEQPFLSRWVATLRQSSGADKREAKPLPRSIRAPNVRVPPPATFSLLEQKTNARDVRQGDSPSPETPSDAQLRRGPGSASVAHRPIKARSATPSQIIRSCERPPRQIVRSRSAPVTPARGQTRSILGDMGRWAVRRAVAR